MTPHARRALALMLALLLPCLSGCWDSKEIDRLAIVTGTALDLSKVPGMIDITMEVANSSDSGSPSSADQGSGGGTAFTMLQATGSTVMSGVVQIDQSSNRKTMPKHNRIRLFGSALCEKGLEDYLDMFMRDQQTRLEVPMLVVEGSARDALSAQLPEGELCGMYLAAMMEDLAEISPVYRVRLIDFIRVILAKTPSAVIPLVKLFEEEDEKAEIKMIGMAVFKDMKMIGRLSNDDGLGYIWAMGKTEKSCVMLEDGPNMAVLHIPSLSCKRKVSMRPDGGVRVELQLSGGSNLTELRGFVQMKPPELLPHLEALGKKEIQERITSAFESAKALNADIFGFGATLYQHHPKQWEGIKDRWDELFADIELSIEVDLEVLGTGQIVQSLSMEEQTK